MSPTVYSPPVPTFTALATETLSGGDTSVTFGSLSGYRDYVIVVSGKAGAGYSTIRFKLNGDGGSNYYEQMARAYNTPPNYYQTATTTRNNFVTTYSAFAANSSGQVVAEFIDAGVSTKDTVMLSKSDYGRDSDGSLSMEIFASRWDNTAAVTSIEVIMDNAGLIAGSVLSIYGVAA